MGDSRTEEYPRDLLQFERQFGTEEACRDYLATLRWPEGFRCRRCGSTRAWSRKARALMECAGRVRLPVVDYGGDDLRPNPHSTNDWVPGNVAGYQREEWHQRPQCSAAARLQGLRDCLDTSSQAPARHGSPGLSSRRQRWRQSPGGTVAVAEGENHNG